MPIIADDALPVNQPPNRSSRGRPGFAVHFMPGHTRYEQARGHLIEHRITVQPSEPLQGDYFSMV